MSEAASGLLAGHRVLVVEDEALVAFLIEDAVIEAGGQVVGPATTLAEALALAASSPAPTAATLDLNLHGQPIAAVADALAARGVPFVVVSGYGSAGSVGLPPSARGARVLAKPFEALDLIQAIAALKPAPGA